MQDYTHSCKVCRKKYRTCNTCNELKSFETWRNIACSMPCYQLWMTLTEFNCGRITAAHAKEYIATLDLDGKEFGEDIVIAMKKIEEAFSAESASSTKKISSNNTLEEIEENKTANATKPYRTKKSKRKNR